MKFGPDSKKLYNHVKIDLVAGIKLLEGFSQIRYSKNLFIPKIKLFCRSRVRSG
jgi:hypothetical protein